MQAMPIRQFKRVSAEQKRCENRVRRCKQATVCLALILTCFGLVSIVRASRTNRALPVVQSPAEWPTESLIVKNEMSPTMVMFVEPESQTATASMNELRRIVMAKNVHAVVVIRKPANSAEQWICTPLIQAASQLPNTKIVMDHSGCEAQHFRVQKSGQCLLYDQMGRLQFDGQLASNGTSSATPQNDRQKIEFILASHPRQVDQQRGAAISAVE